jgi:rhamnulose-1-phosphate aldolase
MKEHPEIERFARVAEWLVRRGWAEANAGNMSYRLEDPTFPLWQGPVEDFPLPVTFPSLEGQHFLVTATRSRARDLPTNPAKTTGLIKITDDGSSMRILWGAGPPTSEFPAHLAIHAMCLEKRREMRAVLHTHPPNLIAMSHLPDLQDPCALDSALRMMHPEVSILVPDGIAGMEYHIPGTVELGLATRDALEHFSLAVWPMHGVVSLAEDMETALDQVEIIEKAAMIYLLVLATGQKPVGLSVSQISDSCRFWGIEEKDK